MAAQLPNDVEVQAALLNLDTRRLVLLRIIGDNQQALDAGRQAIRAAETLVKKFPKTALYRIRLSEACAYTAYCLSRNDPEEAEQLLRRAREISEQAGYEFGVARAWERLGDFLLVHDR